MIRYFYIWKRLTIIDNLSRSPVGIIVHFTIREHEVLIYKSVCKVERNTNIEDRVGMISVAVPGGGTQLFSGRGVRPGFPKCGACELIFASEKGGACEQKISKFRGL